MTEYDIQGTVTDVDGNPVQGVPVYLVNEENVNNVVSTTTDSNGDYIFESHPDVQASNDTYFVAAGGYNSNNNLVTSTSNPNVTADLRPAFFDVSISSTNSPVVEGNDLNVNYSVNNTAGPGTQDIVLDIDGTQEDLDTVTLDPSASTNGTLTWSTVDGENGSYTATVSSDDDSASTGVTIEKDTIQASGGTTVTDATIDGQDYRIHAFENTGSDEFSVSRAPSGETIDVLIVGGGGGSMGDVGGGGGAGGLVFNSNVSINSGSYSVSVGDGGDGAPVGNDFSADATSGQNSSISISGVDTAIGGGHGANYESVNADDGGSGGGDTSGTTSGSGTTGQGNKGGDLSGYTSHESSGGGGAGQAGEGGSSAPRDGGDGLYFGEKFTDTFGENGYFAGGGGGGSGQNNPETGGAGGLGGGGDGKDRETENNGNPGMPNTGGGGGGNAHPHYGGADGGSGIVLIRYRI